MRQIGSLGDEALARRFGDFLVVEGIANDVEAVSDGWAIWVHNEDQLQLAAGHLAHFREHPGDGRYLDASGRATETRAAQQEAGRHAAEKVIDMRDRWHGRAKGFRPVTTLLILASVAVGVSTRFGADKESGLVDLLRFWGARVGDSPEAGLTEMPLTGFERIREGEVWRLFTSMLVHYGPLHLLFNMFWLYDLGGLVELRKGALFLAVLVLVVSALCSVSQNLASGPFGAGMSGVVYGLFGYIWMKDRFQPGEGLALAPSTVSLMLVWLVLCMTGAIGPVGNTAHVVGLLAGMAFGIAPSLFRRARGSAR